ncbi:DUF6504 family protein [Nocardioides sp.]|uniref:DUF6504 family protein n=1 Tax=Nocardioides sp. TaxID=35761 RepID=UPI002B271DFA|nr:DUF6504 family protein [Nocardioides sp.]
MRRYDDSVEVRRGRVDGAVHDDAPAQFLWRGRLWKVRIVLARWVETGAWWSSREVGAALGTDSECDPRSATDLLGEREVWRVEAGPRADELGVFELTFDHDGGRWALVGCDD